MKTSTVMKYCFTALFGLSAATIVSAHPPNNTSAMFQCPVTTGSGPNVLTNFGNYIGGNGFEILNGDSTDLPGFFVPKLYREISPGC